MLTPGAVADERETVEGGVLETVSALVAELGGRPGGEAVSLDDALDRDLGIGSLERVELLLRLEQRFGVRLPDAVMAEAASARELATAVLGAAPAAPEVRQLPRAPLDRAVPAPASAGTLVEVLAWHADARPDRIHLFLREENGQERPITYGALWEQAHAMAAGLRSRGLAPGDTVAIMLRTEPAFFPTFFGVLLAGAVPVPIYPPFRRDQIEEYARRQVGILSNAQAGALVTFPEAQRVAGYLRSRVPSIRAVTSPAELSLEDASRLMPRRAPDDPALVQYTSGSTGDPKGVLLSHANLLANIRAIGDAIAVRPDDVAVSWLPLYHDMGLIGSWLGALYFGIPLVLLSPLAFLSRPSRWLWAVHGHRATISAAPNFAFDLCVRKVGEDEIEGLDLSSWRLALNGSEPVSVETIERFTHRFAAHGFRREAMSPVYGLAEASVAVTMSSPGDGPRVDKVARERFERYGAAVPAPAGEAAPLCFVSCGRPLPGHAVRVVNAAHRPVGDRVEGHIEFRGPSVTSGYYRNPEATRGVLHDGWMDSGDLGYWADGELFVTGRRKDVIIKAGRNLYPQEVEELVGAIPGIRKGCVAAFGVPDPSIGTERLVVIAESRQAGREPLEQLRRAAVDRVVAALGVPPDTVMIAPPGAVLKTSSGKVRRSATRDAYLRGALRRGRPSGRFWWLRVLTHELRARARRARRWPADVLRACYLGALVLLTLPPLWLLVLLAPTAGMADRGVRCWCRAMLALFGCAVRVEGEANLAGSRPAVLAANHASYLDVVVLLAALPGDFRFVAKRELLSTPVVGAVIRRVGHLTVERARVSQSVADAARVTDALRGGLSVLVFPEGTFARASGILPFRLGAFKSAVETGRPVIPITIRGTREILPANRWLPRAAPVTVSIGRPIRPQGEGWPAMVRLRDEVRARIASRSGERLMERPTSPSRADT